MGIEELDAQYTALKASYDARIEEALLDQTKLPTVLPQIQTINQQMAAVLDQMLTELQYAKQSSNSEAYRTQLLETLTRIQSDYNGLKTNTDTMQTLRRIRSFQDTSWQGSLTIYLGIFLGIAVLLVLVVLFRRQKTESAMAPSMSPPAMPALT